MRRPLVAAVALILATSACTADSADGGITVFAAASLTEALTTIGEQYEEDHPGQTVTVNFAASSTLARQITEGAPADVFAAADEHIMQRVTDADATAATPMVFASNRLQLAVPPDNPADVDGIDDLAADDTTVALCAEGVPCGTAGREVLARAGVDVTADTQESDVKAVLTKVRLGEVDAGLVYRTDVVAAGDEVRGIDVDAAADVRNDYPIAPLADAPNAEGARAFVDHVLSDVSRAVLRDAGFETP